MGVLRKMCFDDIPRGKFYDHGPMNGVIYFSLKHLNSYIIKVNFDTIPCSKAFLNRISCLNTSFLPKKATKEHKFGLDRLWRNEKYTFCLGLSSEIEGDRKLFQPPRPCVSTASYPNILEANNNQRVSVSFQEISRTLKPPNHGEKKI